MPQDGGRGPEDEVSGPPPGGSAASDGNDARSALDRLGQRVEAARQRSAPPPTRPQGAAARGLAAGLRIAGDLVAGVLVGGFVGWALDRALGTGPWLLVVFFLVGTAAGFLNVWRTAQALEARARRDAERGESDGG